MEPRNPLIAELGPQERGDLFQPFEQRMTREPGPVQVRGKAAAGSLRSWFMRGRVNADAGVSAADAAVGKSGGDSVACRGDPGATAAGDTPARGVGPGAATTQRTPAGRAAGVPGELNAKIGSRETGSGGEREPVGHARLHGAGLLRQGERGGPRDAEGTAELLALVTEKPNKLDLPRAFSVAY